MALDVYVGALTRYYAGDWQSAADRTGPPGKAKKDCERIEKAVLAWRETLGRSLVPHLDEPFSCETLVDTNNRVHIHHELPSQLSHRRQAIASGKQTSQTLCAHLFHDLPRDGR